MVEIVMAVTPEQMRAELVKWLEYQMRRTTSLIDKPKPNARRAELVGERRAFETVRDFIRDVPIMAAKRPVSKYAELAKKVDGVVRTVETGGARPLKKDRGKSNGLR